MAEYKIDYEAVYADRLAMAERYANMRREACEISGKPFASIVVHDVIDKMGLEADRRFYSGTLVDGTRVNVDELTRPYEGVRRPDKFFDNLKTGERFYYMRYEFRVWCIPDDYKPVPPAVLAERREKRLAKKAEAAKVEERRRFPLLALNGDLD